jgi:hypothetical protein
MNFLNNGEQLYISPNIRCIKRNGRIYLVFENDGNRQVPIEELTFEDKIELFKDTIEGWYFKPIEHLLNIDIHNNERFFKGIIILQSLLPIIELVGQLKTNELSIGRSKFIFTVGFKYLFKVTRVDNGNILKYMVGYGERINELSSMYIEDKFYELIYDHIRNGLFHNALLKAGIKFKFGNTENNFLILKIGNKRNWSRYPIDKNYPLNNIRRFQLDIQIYPNIFFRILRTRFYKLIKHLKLGCFQDSLENLLPRLHGKVETCNFLSELNDRTSEGRRSNIPQRGR